MPLHRADRCPTAPPTTAPTGSAALPPTASPCWAPRIVPWACAAPIGPMQSIDATIACPRIVLSSEDLGSITASRDCFHPRRVRLGSADSGTVLRGRDLGDIAAVQ